MKALIAIDTAGISDVAVRLFARMEFPQADATLLNVADMVMPYTSFGMPPSVEPTNQFVEGLRQAGQTAVGEAANLASSFGLSTKQEVVSGASVLTVLDRATQLNADLIALASTRKGALMTMFTGSMSRSILTTSRIPVLVAKEGVKESGPISAVLATDHSPYAERAVDQFLKFAPRGVSDIHVVTAYDVSDKEAAMLQANLPSLDSHLDQWIEGKLREKSETLVGKLSQHGYQATYSLIQGNPNKVLSEEMKRTGAELMIMGAQGHGFLDRLFVGSVSFNQVVGEPYSVFVLRDK